MLSGVTMKFSAGICLSLVVLQLGFMSLVQAKEDEASEGLRCISLLRINRTEVLDKQHIAFHMKGKKVYVNTLSHACPGLRKNRPFMYRTSLNQLCDLDIITVLYPLGSDFQPGASCGLGRFVALAKPVAESLKGE